MINYYEILDIDERATNEQIKAAYTCQVKIFHPDRYDSSKNPLAYTQALEMTQRLNEIRDTLLDHEKRRIYDLRLELDIPESHPAWAPEPSPTTRDGPASPTKSKSSTLRRPIKLNIRGSAKSVFLAVALIVAIVLISGLDVAVRSAATTLAKLVDINSTVTGAETCPTGAPSVVVTSATINSAGSYVTGGLVTNTTSATIGVNGIGFYTGLHQSGGQPDWVDQLSTMTPSVNPNDIKAGQSVSWTDRHSVYSPISQSGFGPVSISASLDIPETPGTPLVAQWDWPGASDLCQPPN
jgi:hypothetical protein